MQRWWVLIAAMLGAMACSAPRVSSISKPRRVEPIDASSFAAVRSEEVRRLATRYRAAPRLPPLGLTASDGTGLKLVSYRAEAVVDGPLAFTELRLLFDNPTDRELEGRFRVTLPASASVSRFAMKIDARWQEAEVVEKQQARRSYEAFLHRQVDPALLERDEGNAFSARVFPIPARGQKAIIIAWGQEVTGHYELPLRGLPAIGEVDVHLQVRTTEGWRHHRHHASGRPQKAFRVALPQGDAALAERDLVAVRITPPLDGGLEPVRRIAVLFDTSASRGRGYLRAVRHLKATLDALAEEVDAEVEIAAFDQTVSPIYAGPLDEVDLRDLLTRSPLGASDLAAGLSWLAERRDVDHALLFTDAIATAGEGDEVMLRHLRRARGRVERLDVVLDGATTDAGRAGRLVMGSLERDGGVHAGAAPRQVARRMRLASLRDVPLAVEGARWTWPDRLDGMQPGEEIVAFAHLRAPAEDSVRITFGGALGVSRTVPVRREGGPLVVRAATAAAVARIEGRMATMKPGVEREALRRRVVELSVHNRVLSRHTGLLLLETEADYRRFGIDRRSLVDILVVRDGVVAQERDAIVAGERRSIRAATAGPRTPEPLVQVTERDQRQARLCPKSPTLLLMELYNVHRLLERTPNDQGEVEPDPIDPLIPQLIQERWPQSRRRLRRQPSDGASFAKDWLTTPPHAGRFGAVMAELQRCATCAEGILEALRWQREDPDDTLAYVALGEALERAGYPGLAARAYGSLLDLHPGRAEMLRFAAGRLQRLGEAGAKLALEALAQAIADRPDHLTGHRAFAYALLRRGFYEAAFRALEEGFGKQALGRFVGGGTVIAHDLALVGAAWIRAEPHRADQIRELLDRRYLTPAAGRSIHAVLTWETDVADLDLHVLDRKGGHTFPGAEALPEGGEIHADVARGYGPEELTIVRPDVYPYRLWVRLADRSPTGHAVGSVSVVQHDGEGRLTFDHRPFVIMNEGGMVDLGSVERPSW